jgi:hypothetical protein
MELCYRGVAYPYVPADVPMVETALSVQFLGKNYRVRRPIYEPRQSKLNLVYRGVAYSTDGSVESASPRQYPPHIARLSEQLGL